MVSLGCRNTWYMADETAPTAGGAGKTPLEVCEIFKTSRKQNTTSCRRSNAFREYALYRANNLTRVYSYLHCSIVGAKVV